MKKKYEIILKRIDGMNENENNEEDKDEEENKNVKWWDIEIK